MSKKIYVLLAILSVLCLVSCNDKEGKACCKKDPNPMQELLEEDIPSESIFNLESKGVNQNNDSMTFQSFGGKLTIAAMIFTNCPSACPRIVADMQRIESSLTQEQLEKVQFLLISMDPEKDNPTRFAEFMNEHRLNKNWSGISSSQDATMEIANVLNVRVKKLEDGGFDHSNVIHLIDRNGNVVLQQNGLAQDPTKMVEQIKSLM